MTQDEIDSIIASNYEPFILSEDNPCHKASLNPKWRFEKINIKNIVNSYTVSSEDSIRWFDQEVNQWDIDNPEEDNRWLLLEKYYLNNLEELPIIVLLGSDGRYYLNDGHHRYSIAIKNNIDDLYAIVGYSS